MILLASLHVVPIVVAVAIVVAFVTVIMATKRAEHAAALCAEVERAQRVADDAKCVTPAAAQPRATRRVRK